MARSSALQPPHVSPRVRARSDRLLFVQVRELPEGPSAQLWQVGGRADESEAGEMCV